MMYELPKQERDMGMLVHLATFAGYLIPFGNILGPLIVWLMKREDSAFVDACGRNTLNFQISMLIYYAVAIVLAFLLIGFFLIGLLVLLNVIFTIIAAIKASEGKVFKYPLAIGFL
ncbi:DUF4870 domain-containing protein [Shewanella fodinae]|nr:DUF4870 domain-containing protein [Shewanella fodinae]MCL2906137.1 DUF4870 domain-containing protein [Shewanella fodinae]